MTAPDEMDAMFDEPYTDTDEWRDRPVRHRYVHGGFAGTDTRFSVYLPPPERYGGRFFQHITPVPDSEHLAQQRLDGPEDKIGFAIASGAYFLETNGGGTQVALGPDGGDATIAAYRANAAAAQHSRVVAAEMYGEHRPYGYAYGGSGGAYRTVGSMQNTDGVWDGVVPYVLGSPMAIPNMFTVRMHAMRVLRDVLDDIVDAYEPGGGDPYATLDDRQRAAFDEVTRMGFPPPSWFGHRTMGQHAFPVLFGAIRMVDPDYFRDFWTEPGYLGADDPEALREDRVEHTTTVAAVLSAADATAAGLTIDRIPGQARGGVDTAFHALSGDGDDRPVALRLAAVPDGDLATADLVVEASDGTVRRFLVREVAGDAVTVHDAKGLGAVSVGDAVTIDNADLLAVQTYHRHQVPGPEYPVWDQFRDAHGEPRYPQRPMLLGPLFTEAASGALPTGELKGKMILVEALWDREAVPWHADWYRSRVLEHLGDDLDDRFRLWYVDRALHGDDEEQEDPTRTVPYLGVLHQALRDLAAWVEDDVVPPASTRYEVDDGQVVVPDAAADRLGVQPTVHLTVDGDEVAHGRTGQPVTLVATAEAPPGTGTIVGLAWDFDGSGGLAVHESVSGDDERVVIERTHTFEAPGTHFVTVRATSHRDGGVDAAFARIHDLARVRVVVAPV